MELRGDGVVLRPVRPDEIETLWGSRSNDGTGRPPGAVSPAARERFEQRIANSGRFANGRLDLAVEAAGRLVGEVDARHPEGAMPRGVYEIGIALLAAERGKGYGREAIGLLTRHLFENGGAHRVQASTALDNTPMRRVFERVGFAREGVLRSFMPNADGGHDDFVLYAITLDDWRARGGVDESPRKKS